MYQWESTSMLQFKELLTNNTKAGSFNVVNVSHRSSHAQGLIDFNCRYNCSLATLSFCSDVRNTPI